VADPAKSRAGKLGALIVHSRYSGQEITRPARLASLARFERQVLEEAAQRGEELTEAEVARRTDFKRRAYFTRLAALSAKARARKVAK